MAGELATILHEIMQHYVASAASPTPSSPIDLKAAWPSVARGRKKLGVLTTDLNA
jgi:hypothetical protein